MRRVLALPAYRRLLAAYTLNELAWSIGTLALAFLVYERTGSAFGAAAFFLCLQLVPALLSPLLVARLDQRMPRTVLPVLYAIEALAFLALAWIAAHFALVPILVVTALDGIVALAARALVRALTADVTKSAGLLREGNAVINTVFSVCFMAGPAIGGAIVAAAGTSAALLVNCGLFALIALTLATTHGLPTVASERAPSRGRVRAALAYAMEHRPIRALLSLQAVAILFFTVSIPVEVVFAKDTLRAGAGGYGALLSAWGVGAVAGSAAFARWRRLPARQLIGGGAGALGIGFVVMAAAPTLSIAIVGSAVAGVGNGIESVAARTALQEEVEPRWMALMMGFNESMSELVPGLGILIGGAAAALAGPRAAFAIGGVGSLIVTAAVWVVLRPGVLKSEGDAMRPMGVHAGPASAARAGESRAGVGRVGERSDDPPSHLGARPRASSGQPQQHQ